ncbi:hypothetical protein, partial [Pseudoscardovia suis]|uniref:hypothetical protein n=1 Tax=Pseudoscardovia suis TaxID=987063 RepID=UPI003F9AC095
MSASAWLWGCAGAFFVGCCRLWVGALVCGGCVAGCGGVWCLRGLFVGVFEVGVVRRVVCFGAVFVNCGDFVKVCVF